MLTATAIAIVVAMVTAMPVAAAWDTPKKISGPQGASAEPGAIAAAGNTIGMVWAERGPGFPTRVFFRRSTDGGSTWRARVKLSFGSRNAIEPAITARGTTFDVVWGEQDSDGDMRLKYARSTDGGVTWGSRKTLSAAGFGVARPRIARGPSGVVAVTWVNYKTLTQTELMVRVSRNWGATFRGAKSLGTIASTGNAAVAIGQNARIHVAFSPGSSHVMYRRSANLGASWSNPRTIADNAEMFWAPGLAVAGRTVMIGYIREAGDDTWAVYRRSKDAGRHWGRPKGLSSRAARNVPMVVLSVANGEWRAAFARCLAAGCAGDRLGAFLRTSSNNGRTWRKAERVSPSTHERSVPVGVAGGNRPVAAWTRWENSGIFGVYARREA